MCEQFIAKSKIIMLRQLIVLINSEKYIYLDSKPFCI